MYECHNFSISQCSQLHYNYTTFFNYTTFPVNSQAIACFRECLSESPSFIAARESLESLLNHTVDRWHFRMLNDEVCTQE